MRWLKVIAVMLLCSALLSQIHCASLHQPNSQPKRQRRMTPFWRGVSSLRPIGASCKDDIECVTMLCRKNDHKMTKQSSFQISENAVQQHGGPGRATVP